MGEIRNMASDNVTQGLLSLRSSAISNRKAGIRIHVKAPEISTIQISNRKYSPLLRSPWRIAILDRGFCRSHHFLIYGSAIKTPRNTFKRNTYEFLIGGKQGVVTPLTTSHSPLATAFRYSAGPMLDLGYVREHLDVIEKMALDRGVTLDLAAFRELDAERRQIITSIERLKAERNNASGEIARLGKIVHGGDKAKAQIKEHPAGGEETLAAAMAERDALLAKMKTVSDEIKRGDDRIGELDERLKLFLMTIPNIPHSSVPVGKNAADNVEVRRWGTPPKFDFAPKPHWEIGEGAGILDFDAAIKIAGSRFAVYKGLGARLERALANFFLDVHTREHGFTEVLPPFLVNTASLVGVGQLPKFAEDMFHVEGTDLWLTPTSEAELTNLYRDETLDADTLP